MSLTCSLPDRYILRTFWTCTFSTICDSPTHYDQRHVVILYHEIFTRLKERPSLKLDVTSPDRSVAYDLPRTQTSCLLHNRAAWRPCIPRCTHDPSIFKACAARVLAREGVRQGRRIDRRRINPVVDDRGVDQPGRSPRTFERTEASCSRPTQVRSSACERLQTTSHGIWVLTGFLCGSNT